MYSIESRKRNIFQSTKKEMKYSKKGIPWTNEVCNGDSKFVHQIQKKNTNTKKLQQN